MSKVLNNVKERVSNLSAGAKVGITTFAITAGTMVQAFAADGDLDPTVQTAVTNGFTSAGKAIAVIVGLGVTATVGVIAVSGGAKAGLKWVKGIFSKAS
jgi:hypothetical protein